MGYSLISELLAAGTSLTNSTTETVLTSVLIPAHSLSAGKAYSFKGCVVASATNSTDTLTVKCYQHTSAAIGGTAVGTSGAVDVANNDMVYFDLLFMPRSTAGSSSGTVLVTGIMTAPGAEGTVTARACYELVSSVNYGADQYFVVSGQWSVANAGNVCAAQACIAAVLT